ncbi:hypothetical protein JCM5353_005746 [Sporobolomyces roseus]
MADTPMSDSTALSNALPAIPLPALPPISSPAPLASSSSSTPQPQPQAVHIPAPSSAADSENGPPKRKRVRRSEGQPGPGKSWRKGLKGSVTSVGVPTLVAGAGIESLTASPTSHTPATAVPKPSTPSAQPVVHYHHPPVKAFSPLPPFNPTNRTASTLVGAPPKLATQFIAPQVLELGAPRPRRWGRGKMEFRSITGGTIVLTSWQGDTFSPYLDHVSTNSIDELASPPPQSHSYLPPPLVPTSSGMKPSLSRTAPPSQGQRYSPYSLSQTQPQPQPAAQPQYYQPPAQQQQRVYTPNLTLAPPTIPPYHHTPSAQSSPISNSVSPNHANSRNSYPARPAANSSGGVVGAAVQETKPAV